MIFLKFGNDLSIPHTSQDEGPRIEYVGNAHLTRPIPPPFVIMASR